MRLEAGDNVKIIDDDSPHCGQWGTVLDVGAVSSLVETDGAGQARVVISNRKLARYETAGQILLGGVS